MTENENTVDECDFCHYQPVETSKHETHPRQPAEPGTAYLCKVCSASLAGNAAIYPNAPNRDARTISVICNIGNRLLAVARETRLLGAVRETYAGRLQRGLNEIATIVGDGDLEDHEDLQERCRQAYKVARLALDPTLSDGEKGKGS